MQNADGKGLVSSATNLAIDKIPEFAKSEWFPEFLEYYKESFASDKPLVIAQIAENLPVSPQRIFQILDHPYTQDQIRKIVQRIGIKDLPEVYNTIKSNTHNAQQARNYLEYFTPLKPNSVKAGGNININLNILNNAKESAKEVKIEPE